MTGAAGSLHHSYPLLNSRTKSFDRETPGTGTINDHHSPDGYHGTAFQASPANAAPLPGDELRAYAQSTRGISLGRAAGLPASKVSTATVAWDFKTGAPVESSSTISRSDVAQMMTRSTSQAPTLQLFLKSLRDAAQELSPRENLAFLAEAPFTENPRGLTGQIDLVRPYIEGNELPLGEAMKAPQSWKMGESRGFQRGGLAVWRNDVFANDYFVRQYTESTVTGDLQLRMNSQPWFEWLPDKASFEFHPKGAPNRLLKHLQEVTRSESLILHRGTSQYEAQLFELEQQAARGSVPGDWRETLMEAVQQGVDRAKANVVAYEQLLKEHLVGQEAFDKKLADLDKSQSLASRLALAASLPETSGSLGSTGRGGMSPGESAEISLRNRAQ